MIRNIYRIIILIALAICFCGNPCFAETIEILSRPDQAVQYEPFVLKVNLPRFSGNPNDPKRVKVEARILDPNKQEIIVPAFCLQNPKGGNKSLWEVRFTPIETGRYEYHLRVESKQLKKKTKAHRFNVKEGKGDGFLRKSKNNPFYLVFDSGKPFFGLGHNVAWVHNDSIEIFERYFTKLEENGCNLVRVWLCYWSFPIEWKKLGKYDTGASSKLDQLLELAKKKNIYIMLCLDTYGSLMAEEGFWGENRWDANPYNKKNGGPCEKPEDFFTNAEAKRWYKNKLRHVVSRWSYSPNVFAFELWNEYNAPEEWVKEMGAYLKSTNPHYQLVTTSIGYPFGKTFDENDIWRLKEIDVITIHAHGTALEDEIVPLIARRGWETADRYIKPSIISELGIDHARDDKYYDPNGQGTALHNSIWGTALSKYFGTAMNWWWDTYVRPMDLYYNYKALANFLDGVNWNSRDIKFVDKSMVMRKLSKDEEIEYKDVVIKPKDKWGKIHSYEFAVLNDGDVFGGEVNKYLHGKEKKNFKADLFFHVIYPSSGKFVIRVGMVAQGGELVAYIDDEEVLRKEFPAGPGEGPWKRSLFRRDQKVYQGVYNTDVEIDVPIGDHTIRLTNEGKDWIGIKRIILKKYKSTRYADARCLGLHVGDQMLFWIHNKSNNWKNTFAEKKPEPITDAYFKVFGVQKGTYEIEWWDTHKGSVIFKDKIEAKESSLYIELPEFLKDIACKVRKK